MSWRNVDSRSSSSSGTRRFVVALGVLTSQERSFLRASSLRWSKLSGGTLKQKKTWFKSASSGLRVATARKAAVRFAATRRRAVGSLATTLRTKRPSFARAAWTLARNSASRNAGGGQDMPFDESFASTSTTMASNGEGPWSSKKVRPSPTVTVVRGLARWKPKCRSAMATTTSSSSTTARSTFFSTATRVDARAPPPRPTRQTLSRRPKPSRPAVMPAWYADVR
mmetsp:Transcript_34724/g.111369  ORF Transcript_34724/g.111369 Transcript_34724/m.111369 type:complete len:225 (+) Transcript_34724:110-784(+)